MAGVLSKDLDAFVGNIPDEQLVIVPDPVTGKLYRSTFGKLKSDIIVAIGEISYLDQIIEVEQVANLPDPGQVKTIYVITGEGPDQNKQFRWGGTMYIEFPRGDGDVAAEAILRANADAALQQNIDDLERELLEEIEDEVNARKNADIALQQAINAEANTRAQKDSDLQAQINNLQLNLGNHFRGRFTSLQDLKDALPTANPGDYAQVDEGPNFEVINYNWDEDDGWVQGGSGSGATSTDELPEGTTNLYFKTSRVLGTKLAGLQEEAQQNIEATDTALSAFGKIKKFISSLLTSFNGPKQLVKLEEDGKLPALDGSKLTGIEAGAKNYYGTASGTNVYIAAVDGYDSYQAGVPVQLLVQNANTGASTININSLGAKAIVKNGSEALAKNDIRAGSVITCVYDGTNMQLQGVFQIPGVASGEKVVTVKNDGARADYNLLDANSASGTTGAQLAIMDWSNGFVSRTGVYREERFYNGYLYICTGTNIWSRIPYDLIIKDYIIADIDDSAGVKTSIQMTALYPNAVRPQAVYGVNGKYEYIGNNAWMYFENKITM